jgi:hypothetical protein
VDAGGVEDEVAPRLVVTAGVGKAVEKKAEVEAEAEAEAEAVVVVGVEVEVEAGT